MDGNIWGLIWPFDHVVVVTYFDDVLEDEDWAVVWDPFDFAHEDASLEKEKVALFALALRVCDREPVLQNTQLKLSHQDLISSFGAKSQLNVERSVILNILR